MGWASPKTDFRGGALIPFLLGRHRVKWEVIEPRPNVSVTSQAALSNPIEDNIVATQAPGRIHA